MRRGNIVFIPQADLPCTAHAGIGHGGGIGVHGTALYFAALPTVLLLAVTSISYAVWRMPSVHCQDKNSGPVPMPMGAVR